VEVQQRNPLLLELVLYFADISFNTYGKDAICTSIYRGPGDPMYDAKSVHGKWRGADFRSRIYKDWELSELDVHVNRAWLYDLDRPHLQCMLVHGEGYNRHIHLQVHPNTVQVET
jgi:hypothetical protein